MKSIHYEDFSSPRLPHKLQLQRLQQLIREELTPLQRETILAYYFREQTIPEIAKKRNVHKSTVCRTLHRAERKLKQFMKY